MKQFKMFLVLCFRQSLYPLRVLNASDVCSVGLGALPQKLGSTWCFRGQWKNPALCYIIYRRVQVINNLLIRNPFLSTVTHSPNPLHPLVRNPNEVLKHCMFGWRFFPQKQIYASKNSVSKQLKFFRNLGQI